MKINNYKIETVVCKICGYTTNNHQSFNSHITHKHKIKSKDYYDLYIKQESEGLCKYCGKETKFKNMWIGYLPFCSNKCAQSNKDIQAKKIKTCQSHWNVDWPGMSLEIQEKMANTNLERFNATNVFASEYGKQKIKETSLKKYGISNPGHSKEAHSKAQKTMRKNGNNSSIEDYFEQQLITKQINYKKQYNQDNRYPWKCDFYLPDIDTFIELHIYWIHGNHWFDSTNNDDIRLLNKWKQLSDNNLYTAAINTWTNIDLYKRDTALANNLNYVVLRSKEEIDDYIQSLN